MIVDMKHRGKTLLITTGATTTFRSLVEISLNGAFLDRLITLAVTHMILQFGVETEGWKLVHELIRQLTTQSDSVTGIEYHDSGSSSDSLETNQTPERTFNFRYRDSITVSGFNFSFNLGKFIDESDLVVSHAGTGSILDVLSKGVKLLAVVNDKLMDNHQSEIANELEQQHYVIKCNAVLDELIRAIAELDAAEQVSKEEYNEQRDSGKAAESRILIRFPKSDSSVLPRIINTEAGFIQ